jgi:hypothetical protein
MTAVHDSLDDAHLLSIFIDNVPDIDMLRAEEGLILGSHGDEPQFIAMRGDACFTEA